MHSLDSVRTPELSLISAVVDQAIRDYTDQIPEALLEKPRRALKSGERARIAGHFDAVRWVHSLSPEKEWISFQGAMEALGLDPDEVRSQLKRDPQGVRARLNQRVETAGFKEVA